MTKRSRMFLEYDMCHIREVLGRDVFVTHCLSKTVDVVHPKLEANHWVAPMERQQSSVPMAGWFRFSKVNTKKTMSQERSATDEVVLMQIFNPAGSVSRGQSRGKTETCSGRQRLLWPYSKTCSGRQRLLWLCSKRCSGRQRLLWLCSKTCSGRQWILWLCSKTCSGDDGYCDSAVKLVLATTVTVTLQ